MQPLTGLQTVSCPLCEAQEAGAERTLDGYALQKCKKCGFVYVNPQPTDAQLAQIYGAADEAELIAHYERNHTPARVAGYHAALDRIERLLPGKGRLLDYGCGPGYFHEQAALRGFEAHGCDLGEWTQAAAKKRGVENLHVGRLQDLPFPDGYFDVVHSAQVLEHLPRPQADLAELYRLLRPGGLLYVDVPNYRTLPIMLGRDDFMLNLPPQHLNYFTPATLRSLLKRAGFQEVRVSTAGGLKLENLFGKRVRMIETESHNPTCKHGESPGPVPPPANGSPGAAARLKGAVRSALVRPLLYERLKIGLLLIGTARKPLSSESAA